MHSRDPALPHKGKKQEAGVERVTPMSVMFGFDPISVTEFDLDFLLLDKLGRKSRPVCTTLSFLCECVSVYMYIIYILYI